MSQPVGHLERLEARRTQARLGGGEEQIAAQHARGKLTARERIARFLDEGSFQELDPYLTHRATDFGMADRKVPGDAVVTGSGRVGGRLIYVYAQDFTVFGGSFSEAQALKVARVMDLAVRSGHPVVGLNDSVGARIQEGVYGLAGYAELFWRNTQASGVVPQISVMLGPCAGGSVYSPGLTDFVIMTRGLSHMFITGPDVIRTVTGEEVDFDTLGGAVTHASKSGVAHLIGDDEAHALTIAQRLLSYLPDSNREPPPYVQPADDPQRKDAALDALLQADAAQPHNAHQIIARIFDRGTFFEVHRYFATSVVVGFARMDGYVVGVLASQPAVEDGALDTDAADKAARFVRFCDAFNVPLVTLVDAPGFVPGEAEARRGLVRHAARLAFAYAEATVPRVAVFVRRVAGGVYAVLGRPGYAADLAFAWPSAEFGAGQEAFDAAEAGLVNDVIKPSETRPRLIAALEMLRGKVSLSLPKTHGNMPD
jgi:acetyl-CoA carboxylase carboxyltransferase component